MARSYGATQPVGTGAYPPSAAMSKASYLRPRGNDVVTRARRCANPCGGASPFRRGTARHEGARLDFHPEQVQIMGYRGDQPRPDARGLTKPSTRHR